MLHYQSCDSFYTSFTREPAWIALNTTPTMSDRLLPRAEAEPALVLMLLVQWRQRGYVGAFCQTP